jgi:hypothetical protein
MSDVGTISGRERFLRGNRSTSDFVGADGRDLGGFVGMQQANTSTRVLPPATTLRPPTTPDANHNARVDRSPIYEPQLTLNFQHSAPADQARASTLSRRLRTCLAQRVSGQIEVSMEGRTATLRGVVASESDRALVQRMVLFEPGVSQVRNELAVQSPAAFPTPPPAPTGPPSAEPLRPESGLSAPANPPAAP